MIAINSIDSPCGLHVNILLCLCECVPKWASPHTLVISMVSTIILILEVLSNGEEGGREGGKVGYEKRDREEDKTG